MKIQTNYEKINLHLYDVMHLFYENEKQDFSLPFLEHKYTLDTKRNVVVNYFKLTDMNGDIVEKSFEDVFCRSQNEIEESRFVSRLAKKHLYEILSQKHNRTFLWGCLTGIRPTKIVYDLIANGTPYYNVKDTLIEEFKVKKEKAKLAALVVDNQKSIIRNDNLVDVYVNIPFCPSRCNYCSFISNQYGLMKDIIPDYLNALVKEIDATKALINRKSLIVRTVYVGGGTPSVLSADELDFLLENLNFAVNEFTVECGRPDTITKEKLDVLKKHNVTRISINPQSFIDATLKRIGRNHTVRQIIDAYKLTLDYDFQVNMDLIAGLSGDNFKNFKKSLDTACLLAPDNITVHTLSVKKTSEIDKAQVPEDVVEKMIDYSSEKLKQEGYKPYYLYKQKNQTAGLENVGYYKNKVCIFNIDSMEETTSILACGANAISKKVESYNNKIERFANLKDVRLYIEKINDMIAKKNILFC